MPYTQLFNHPKADVTLWVPANQMPLKSGSGNGISSGRSLSSHHHFARARKFCIQSDINLPEVSPSRTSSGRNFYVNYKTNRNRC